MKRILLIITLFPFGLINAQINTGMVAHFPFNNNLSDISTSAVSATNNGCTFSADRNGVANNAINFNNSGYISFTGNSLKNSSLLQFLIGLT